MTGRLAFILARTLRREAPLMAMSAGAEDLRSELAGKRVALIGNARALSGTSCGAAIDAADLVIRINRAPMPSALSHGTRTDWLALATSIPAPDLDRLSPRRILWMSHKRKRLPYAVATSPGFYLHPLEEFRRLRTRLGAPPTTGVMMIDLLAAAPIAGLTLYGFDFMASLSLTGRRTAAQVPHDFAAERAFVENLFASDGRMSFGDR